MSDTNQRRDGTSSQNKQTGPERKTYPTHAHAWAALVKHWGEPDAHWTYRDREGQIVGLVLRWNRAGGKELRPLARVQGGWTIGAMPAARPLYRLPEVLVADRLDRVFVVEGEKAADAGAQVGLCTTTSAGGSAAAHQTDWSPLAGRNVVVLPDNDEPGRKYAHAVIGQLVQLSPQPTIRLVTLPKLPRGGDLADFVAARPAGSTDTLAREIEALCGAALPVQSAAHLVDQGQVLPASPSPAINQPSPPQGEAAIMPVVSRLSDCEPTTVRWLWPGRIQLGKLTLLVGDPGLGKSFLTLDLAARITRGAALPALDDELVAGLFEAGLPGSQTPATAGSVVLLSAEDDANDTICPRFLAAGGVASRMTVLHAVAYRDASSGQKRETHFSLATDLNVLEEVIRSLGDCRLVVIDPITAYLGTSDSHNNAEMRALLAPISALAARTGVALLAINHLNKANQGPVIYRSMGSVAFAATARSALAVLADPYEGTARLLAPIKSNLASAAVGMRYRIVSRAGDEQPVIQWDTVPVRMTADELLAAAAQSAAAGGATMEAADWLTEMLRDGPQPASELKTLAKSDGIHERTLLRAKSRLGLVTRRAGVGLAGTWLWQWPAGRPIPAPQPPDT